MIGRKEGGKNHQALEKKKKGRLGLGKKKNLSSRKAQISLIGGSMHKTSAGENRVQQGCQKSSPLSLQKEADATPNRETRTVHGRAIEGDDKGLGKNRLVPSWAEGVDARENHVFEGKGEGLARGATIPKGRGAITEGDNDTNVGSSFVGRRKSERWKGGG